MADATIDAPLKPPVTQAERPRTRISRTGGFLARLWERMSAENIGLMAAGVAFYCFLSLVPLLGALILSYGLIADPATVSDHIRTIVSIVPRDAAKLILDQLLSVVTSSASKTGFGLLLALLLAIYGATRASTAMMSALNVIYGQRESRSFLIGTLVSCGIIVGAVAVAITGLLAATVLGWLQTLVGGYLGPVAISTIKVGTWLVAAVLASAAIGATYRFGPAKAPAGWQWLSFGSFLATLLWLAATIGLGVYVSRFGNYNATYGSLSAVVVLLMWFYVSAYAILLGATVNSVISPPKRWRVQEEAAHPPSSA